MCALRSTAPPTDLPGQEVSHLIDLLEGDKGVVRARLAESTAVHREELRKVRRPARRRRPARPPVPPVVDPFARTQVQAEAEARIAEHAARASVAEEKAAAAAARAAELESRLAAADLAAVDAKEQLAEHLSWSSARLDQLQEHLSPGGSVAPRPPPWSGASYDDDAAPAAGTPGSSKSKTFGSLDGKSPRRRWHEPANGGGGGEQASLARLRAEKRDLARAPPVVCGV